MVLKGIKENKMIETDNYQAIELIKKHYTKYITEEIKVFIKKHDFYTNLLIGMMILCIVLAIFYARTKIVVFIMLVPASLGVGMFASYKRTIYSKEVVAAINQQISKQK